MKERNISQYKLIKDYHISTGQLDRLRKNENVNSYTLNQLCKILIAGLKILQNMWKMNKKFCLISQ
mgnify:FL=1